MKQDFQNLVFIQTEKGATPTMSPNKGTNEKIASAMLYKKSKDIQKKEARHIAHS